MAADEDTVREVIHRFNEIGLACLDPQWAGGRPRLLGKLAAFLATTAGRAIRIGREALRCLLARRGITFQCTKTWKESTDPERDTKLDRIEHVLENFPDRTFAFDEFGPLGLRPTGGACWAGKGEPDRVAATYTAPMVSPTSTAATRLVTTRSGASTTATKAPPTPSPC